ncbi:MAG: PAC2 family protein [Dehalococcoidia bacterium]
MESIIIHNEPELVDPCMVAAWPGVGNVALIAATYLKDKLEALEFGEIRPTGFFDPGGVFIKGNLIEPPQFPQSKFYYRKCEGEGRDIIIFLSEAQPASASYVYAGTVLDVAQRFGVRRIYTLAAALTEHHPEKPRALAAATDTGLLEELKSHDVVLASDFYIAGLNGLLLGAAKERGMEGICLLGETARYTAKIANPRSSKAVIEILTRLLRVEIDMSELEDLAASTEKQIKEIGDELRREYLQNFTRPIWERDEGTGNV